MNIGRYTVDTKAAAISILADFFWAGLAGLNAVEAVDQYIDGDKTGSAICLAVTFMCLSVLVAKAIREATE